MILALAVLACLDPRATVAPGASRAARTLTVSSAGDAEFGDIAAALAGAVDGDRVEVAPGNYYGSVDFDGKSVAVVSTGGPDATWIYASPGQAAVRVREGEGAGTVLEGFTVTGGGNADDAAVEVSFALVTLRNVRLTGNRGRGVVHARSAQVTLDRVVVEADNAATSGVLVEARRGIVALLATSLACGRAPTGYLAEHGAVFIDGSSFDCPGAVAVSVFHDNARVQRSRVRGVFHVENENDKDEATVVEGTVFTGGVTVSTAKVELTNVVLAGAGLRATDGDVEIRNAILTGADCALEGTDGAEVEARYSVFWGNTANSCGVEEPIGETGNVQAPPLFVDAAGGDYHLRTASPAVDAGDDDDTYLDLDGTRADAGAHGGPFNLDGGW